MVEGGVASYPYVHRERVRFRDCDAIGHVNNAV
jgi:acyl-CoA thioesterase FadM